MSYANHRRFSIAGFAIACVIALAVNGSVLLGFDRLAQSSVAVGANQLSQMAAATVRAG